MFHLGCGFFLLFLTAFGLGVFASLVKMSLSEAFIPSIQKKKAFSAKERAGLGQVCPAETRSGPEGCPQPRDTQHQAGAARVQGEAGCLCE